MVRLIRTGSNIMQTQPFEPGRLYLSLFHGRKSIDEQLDDWGFDGPTIGPLEYVQVTYMCDVKFAASPAVMDRFFPDVMTEWRAKGYSNVKGPLCDWQFHIEDDLIRYQDAYFGDWSVFLAGLEPGRGVGAGLATAPVASLAASAVDDDGGRIILADPRPPRALAASALPFRLPPIAPISRGAMRAH